MIRFFLTALAAVSFSTALAQTPDIACPAPPYREPTMHEVVAAYDFAPAAQATICAVKSGTWNDATTWSTGKIPTAGDFVWVPPGLTLSFDARAARAGIVLVDGAFKWSRGRTLTVDTMIIADGGELEIGTVAAPATGQIVIADNGPIDVARDKALVSRGVLLFGRTRIEGVARQGRARVITPPRAGDTTVSFSSRPKGWRVNDEIVIAGTRLIPFRSFERNDRAKGTTDERRRIVGISRGVITLDRPLEFDHLGPDPSFLTVAVNLTRSVVFRNENPEAAVPVRGHILAAHTQDIRIRHAQIVNFGRTDKSFDSNPDRSFDPLLPDSNVKGRYSLHLHMLGHGARRALVEGVAIDGGAGWGIAQHDTDADLLDNVVYDVFGSGIVAERGGEAGLWRGNTVIKMTGRFPCISKGGDSVLREDLARCGEALWISRLVDVQDTVVAGVMNSSAIVNMTRLPPSSVPVIPPSRLFHPSVIGAEVTGVSNDRPPIRSVKNLEAFAVHRGIEVQKSNPRAYHAIASLFDGVKLWNVSECGAHLAYTSNYVLKDFSLTNDPNYARANCGLELATSSLRLTLVDPKFTHVRTGVIGDSDVKFDLKVPRDLLAVNLVCNDCSLAADAGVTQLSGEFPAGPPRVTLTGELNAAPTGQYAGASLSGVVEDALGPIERLSSDFEPVSPRRDWFVERIQENGWCERDDGQPAYAVFQLWSERLSGATTETRRDLALGSFYDPVRAEARFNGLCRDMPSPGSVSADAARVPQIH